MTGFKDVSPLNMIFNDYNNHHSLNDVSTAHKLTMPTYLQGFMFGFKIHARYSEFGGNVNFNNFSTLAEGVDSSSTSYIRKISFSHNGFNLLYRVLFVNTNYFRMGPGIGFKIEQYRTRVSFKDDPSLGTMIPTNRALVSGQLNYNLSFGGPKFNFDIGVYYQIPFWKLNLSNLNSTLNEGYAKTYSAAEMTFNPVSYGVVFSICLGSKDNYDF